MFWWVLVVTKNCWCSSYRGRLTNFCPNLAHMSKSDCQISSMWKC